MPGTSRGTRSQPLKLLALLLISPIVLAACAGGADDASGDAATITVTDLRGETNEFDEAPERIFVTSYRYVMDELVLLGETPVGFGAHASEALASWTQGALDDMGVSPERVDVTDGLNSEAIAALAPDVIIANEYEEDSYEDLARIAPLVVVSGGLDLEGERLATLGQLVGKQDAAAEVTSEMTKGFDKVTATGDEVALIFLFLDGGVQAAVEFGDAKNREGELLTLLGLNVKSDWPVAPNEYGYGVIAEENFDLFGTADMVWNQAPYPGDFERDKDALLSSPVLQSLDVYQRGDVTIMSADLSQAMSFWTPLATPTLIDGVNGILAGRSTR